MGDDDEDYLFDDESGEWLPASQLAAKQAADAVAEVRDAVGNLLANGDQVTLIKDLGVKGVGRTLKQGTVIKSIRLPERFAIRLNRINRFGYLFCRDFRVVR